MSKGQEPIGSEAGQAEERKSPVKKETAPGAGSGISRRNFLRMGGVAAAAATPAGRAAAGGQVGRSTDAYYGGGPG